MTVDGSTQHANFFLFATDSTQENEHAAESSWYAYPISPSLGTGAIEVVKKPYPDLHVVRSKIQLSPDNPRRLIPILEALYHTPNATTAIHIVHAGRAVIRSETQREDHWMYKGTGVVQHAERLKFSILIDTGEDSDITTLVFNNAELERLLGESEATAFLNAALQAGSPTIGNISTPPHLCQTLLSEFRLTLSHNAYNLHAQAKALEFISALAAYTSTQQRTEAADGLQPSLAQQIFNDVSNINGNTPRLAVLSQRYGVSEKTLNEAFKAEFGQTIGAYVSELHLCEAHAAILTSETPIKVLAAEFGYSHVNNFTAAFKRRFGYTPGSLRRNKAAQHGDRPPSNGSDHQSQASVCKFSGGRLCRVAGNAPCCEQRKIVGISRNKAIGT